MKKKVFKKKPAPVKVVCENCAMLAWTNDGYYYYCTLRGARTHYNSQCDEFKEKKTNSGLPTGSENAHIIQ
jgi:hypothetical protein